MTETKCKTNDKPTLAVSEKNSRKRLFTVLNNIITFADEKRLLKGNSDQIKQQWSRIAVSAISAYGSLLKDVDLESIMERLETLEKQQETENIKEQYR